jgi:hypothetical protein
VVGAVFLVQRRCISIDAHTGTANHILYFVRCVAHIVERDSHTR